jgi:hypothetical protein
MIGRVARLHVHAPCYTPERLNADHEVAAFANGRHATLDHWLAERALASEGASARTYVVCNADRLRQVVGYYTITTAMKEWAALPRQSFARACRTRCRCS